MVMSRTASVAAAASVLFVTALPVACAATPVAPPPQASPSVAPVPSTPTPEATPTVTTATPDFDGDGKADLASTFDDDQEISRIQVNYGSGVTDTTLGPAAVVLARNLNGDAYTDLVLADVDGTVSVLFGSASGLELSSKRSFGASAVAAGDYPHALALVEKPRPRIVMSASPGAGSKPGKLVVYTLGANGLPTPAVPTVLQSGKGGVPRVSDWGSLGYSLASAGAQLFVGAPYAKVSGRTDAGAVVALTFKASGVKSGRVITQNTKGVGSTAAKSDSFGWSVAARGSYLAVGAPWDQVGSARSSGSVQLFKISKAGKLTPYRRITQATRGVPGKVEKYDLFGRAVELGAACPGRTTLYVGGSGEAIVKGHRSDGSVWVLPLKATKACPARQLWEGHGLSGKPTWDRGVGDELAVLRSRGATTDELAIAGWGSYSEGPTGLLAIWSPRTLTERLRVEGFYRHLAGR